MSTADEAVSPESTQDSSTNRVAKEFTRLYYRILNDNPEYLHQFYGPTSTVTVSETQDDGTNLTIKADTLELIKGLTLTMFAEVRVSLTNCTPQSSLGDSVQLMVSGVMHQKNSVEERLFTQALLLAKQDQGYFILNDTVHVHSKHNSGKILSFSADDQTTEPNKEVPTTPPLEQEVKSQEKQETEHETQESQEELNPPQVLSQELEGSKIPDVAASEPNPVMKQQTNPIGTTTATTTTTVKATTLQPDTVTHTLEDETVGLPIGRSVLPISKPNTVHPPPAATQSLKPKSYRDAVNKKGHN